MVTLLQATASVDEKDNVCACHSPSPSPPHLPLSHSAGRRLATPPRSSQGTAERGGNAATGKGRREFEDFGVCLVALVPLSPLLTLTALW